MKTFKTTWRNIRRSPYQALVAIFIMTITFYYVSFFAFNFYASAKAISYFESRPQVTAFFENEVKQADIDNLKNELMATNKVASAKFVSKQDALKIYREQNKDDPLLLELVTADILPASLEISTVKIGNLSEINNSFIISIYFHYDNYYWIKNFSKKTGHRNYEINRCRRLVYQMAFYN